MPQRFRNQASLPSHAGIDARLIADTTTEPAWRSLEIDAVTIGGRQYCVREERALLNPFSVLATFQPDELASRPSALVVMAMSGHHALLLRDMIVALLADFNVAVLDWVNARHVPLFAGEFGFADNVAAVVTALQCLPRGTHLIGVCQGSAPAIAAASLLHQMNDPARPASLCLMGGPVDPDANATRVSTMLTMTPIRWLERDALAEVPDGFSGAGRSVYPAATQQHGLLSYLTRQLWRDAPIARKVLSDDGLEPERLPFLTLYTSVKDIPGAAFTQSIAAIYHDRALWTGRLAWDGQPICPWVVTDMPLMTIEAPDDDIAAPGQTLAAHELFSGLGDDQRRHLLLNEGDHFSLFHGRLCRETVVPAMSAFLRSARVPD